MSTPGVPQITMLPLSKLRAHPLQWQYETTTSPEEDKALAADLLSRGQLEPISVLPPKNIAGLPAYTMLDGHRRLIALKANGETEAKVTIRHDLAHTPANELEAEFLRCNLVRRQLHPVDHARIELRLFAIQQRRNTGRLTQKQKAQFCELLARQLQMSPRNARRYASLVETPIEIQRAVRDGQLSITIGEKLSNLRPAQREIARRIRAGEPPKKVVAEYLGTTNRRHRNPVDALSAFAKGLERGLDDLDGRVEHIRGPAVMQHRPILEQAHVVIGRLLSADGNDAGDSRRDLRAIVDGLRDGTS